jgi:acetolactate synthase-1/2/3 large subunit
MEDGMAEITGGELLLKCLQAEGVTTIFGVLDGSHNAFLAKLDKYGMRFVSARHEAAAAHMAEAWARITGTPGVVITGIGPGAANMVSGVITAHAEGSPLIAISGQRRRSIIYPDRGGGFQVASLVDLYAPVTKWSAGLRVWQRLPELVRQAYRRATSGRPGPVYLEIPEDLLRGTGDEDDAPVFEPAAYRVTRLGSGDPALVQQAVQMLLSAQRPLLHAGTGVAWSGAWDELLALTDHLGACVTTTLAARGVVPEDHPRYFHPLDRDALEAAQAEADVVLAVGTRFGELDGWGRPPLWGATGTQTVIQVDSDPASIGVNRPVDLALIGDAQAVLRALLAGVAAGTAPRPPHPDVERYHALSARWQAQRTGALRMGKRGINPGQLVQTVREFFPRDAITVMDGGNTSLWCASYNPIYTPRSYLYTAKFGHLGTGLPYAVGAKLAAPERLVYLVSGDGAFGFNIQELETAVRHGAAFVAIVSVDRGWGMERSSQMMAQLGHFVETDLHPDVRYDQIAMGFGCHGEFVTSLDELLPALERSVASAKPAVIQAMVDVEANMAPPGLLEFGSMVYRATD